MILALCDRFKKLPSEIYEEDTYLLTMLLLTQEPNSTQQPSAPAHVMTNDESELADLAMVTLGE